MRFIILQAGAIEAGGSFLDSPWWKFASLMTKAVLVALWLAMVYWTYKDAKRRIDDRLMIGVAVVASFIFPFIGTLFYTIVRPPEYLDDVLERDLEIRAREQELVGGSGRCPACRIPVRDDFLVCPKCRRRLKEQCATCGKPLDESWRVCPYCEAEMRTGRAAMLGKMAASEEDELFA